ncbi:MAG: HAD family hydrolase [Rhizobiales bacterium]|nr:HAD family hydrolase [Hyphomicrobiales bacterium]MBA67839.1 HAD family hydrolase [Hyphomicrobiales bacterium]|tara:strand:- start:411 stop:1118 length:708 start_codon:yes stop_codon:yes gene_type:complete
MAATLSTIGFDADDTLWQNEQFFRFTEQEFAKLLADHGDHGTISARLLDAERRNLGHYGFGVKGFTLSMIETAIEVTEGRAPATVISRILEIGRDLMDHPMETLPGAVETLEALSERYTVVLITKGDLFHQEKKLAQSGLGDFFDAIEIVSDKKPATYASLFARHGDGAEHAMMVGNSLKSDVIPAIEAGGWGVHVPHELTWALEHADAPQGSDRFREIATLAELPDLVSAIRGR